MHFLRTGDGVRGIARKVVRWSLQASLLVGLAACNQTEAGEANATAPVARRLAEVRPSAAPPSPAATHPTSDGLDAFTQALARKVDRSQMTTRPLPGGGFLHSPNGRAAHAAVLVRNSDGTLKRECVSSPAEVSALTRKMREGAGQ